MNQLRYKNLAELLLNAIHHQPGMYLGKNHISALTNFISGYQFKDQITSEGMDFYFGKNGFMKWYCNKYNPLEMSLWKDYFLYEVNNDEAKAMELYFMRLEEYYTWYQSTLT